MKKALITIFAIIGVISTVLILLGVGYMLGTKDRPSEPVPTVTVAPEPTATDIPTSTPTVTPTPEPTVAEPTVTSIPTETSIPTPKPTEKVEEAEPTATLTPTPSPVPTATSTPTPEPTPKYTFTEMKLKMLPIGEVSVRDLPCAEGNKLDTVSEDNVRVIAVQAKCNETGWYLVEYYSNNLEKKVTGYIDSAFLKEKPESNPTPAPTETPTQTETPNKPTPTPSESTSQKPSTTPKPTQAPKNPNVIELPSWLDTSTVEYAPAGTVFTDTVTINGVQVEATGTIRIHGVLIVDVPSDQKNVKISYKEHGLSVEQLDDIDTVYLTKYGDKYGSTGAYTTNWIFEFNWDGGEFATGDGINLNPN